MRIAYFAPAWPPAGAANGIVTYVAAMRRQLLDEGHEVSVIAQNTLHTAEGCAHELEERRDADRRGMWERLAWRYDRSRGEHPVAARRLARQFRRARAIAGFDLIEMEESFGWSRAAQDALDVPVVTRLHGPQFLKPRGISTPRERRQARQRIAAEGRAIGRAPGVSAPTEATLASTRSFYAQPLATTAVIPNPVVAYPDAPAWRAAREPGLILYVGRFDQPKGADTMVEAFALLASCRSDVRLIMVGPDDGIAQADGAALKYDAFAERMLTPDIRARIEFTGTLSPERIIALRRRAALTVVASRNENLPFAIMEAMAAASPLISTAWDGSAEVIDDGVTGWLTPVGAADRLADRMAWALANPDAAERVGAAAWRHCRDAYAPAHVGRRSLAFYAGVIARHGQRG